MSAEQEAPLCGPAPDPIPAIVGAAVMWRRAKRERDQQPTEATDQAFWFAEAQLAEAVEDFIGWHQGAED